MEILVNPTARSFPKIMLMTKIINDPAIQQSPQAKTSVTFLTKFYLIHALSIHTQLLKLAL